MLRENVKDKNNKTIGTRLVFERGIYINKLEEKRNNLLVLDGILNCKYERILKTFNKKNKKKLLEELVHLQDKKNQLENEINELLNARVYDHFKDNDFNASFDGELKFISIMTPQQKERQKKLNKKYNLIRINNINNFMITLNEDNYKK